MVIGLTGLGPAGLGAGSAAGAVHVLTSDERARFPDIVVDENGTAHVVWHRRGTDLDDDVVYCRVPRGATACAASRSFGLRGVADPPKVNLMPTGELVITSERYRDDPAGNDASNKVYAISSTDGGATFGAPRVIADRAGTIWGWGGEVEAGPGDFSLSLFGNDGGCNQGLNYSAAPLDGFTTQAAEVTDDCFKAYEPSVAFVDPVTPIVAYTGGPVGAENRIFFRRWSGSGTYNDAARWLPEVDLGPGNEPRLASGLRGTYLLYRNNDFPRSYWVRRFDQLTNTFGPPTRVSTGTGSEPIFRDFHQDPGGTLHAVFKERPPGEDWQLRHRISRDGQTWEPVEVLADEDNLPDGESFFNLRVGAAPDGGGAVVTDAHGEASIRFVPFAASGPGHDACPTAIKVGETIVRALTGCFRKRRGARVATGPVKVNGVDVEPGGQQARMAAPGASASGAPFKVTVNPKERTLRANSPANVRVGNIVLERGQVGWRLPKGTGKVVRLGPGDSSVFSDLGKHAKKLFGFPVKGDAELLIGAGETAQIPTSFQLPKLIGGVSGAVTLRTDQSGFVPSGLKITAPQAKIGLLRIGKVDVTYEGHNRFMGSASFELPVAYDKSFNVGFGFEEGRLHFVHVDTEFSPALRIVPPEIVSLRGLGFDYVDEVGSRKFIGSVGMIAGPELLGARLIDIDGKVFLEFPASKPATLGATGDASLFGLIPLATAAVNYRTDGLFTFNGLASFPPPEEKGWRKVVAIDAGVKGFLELKKPFRFSAAGGASVCVAFEELCGFGEGVVSSKGITGCATATIPITEIEVAIGGSWKWGDKLPVPVCQIGAFKLTAPVSAQAAQVEGVHSVRIGGGLPQAALEIAGQGGAPRVTVTAPNGDQVTSGNQPVVESRFIAQQFNEASKTYVTIGSPPAGTYTVEPEPGSPAITAVRVASGIPEPKVTAKVIGKGRTRTLRYRARRIAGQRITFAEQSAGGLYREFAASAKPRGTIRFRPRDSADRRRQVIALVEQNGLPRARINVAAFKAPKPRPMAAPKRLRVRRKGSKLIVGWSKVRRAREYQVRINLPRDGRRLLRFTERRKLQVRGLERNDKGKITVQAIGADAMPGKAKKAKLKPRKHKRRGR